MLNPFVLASDLICMYPFFAEELGKLLLFSWNPELPRLEGEEGVAVSGYGLQEHWKQGR